MKKCLCLLVAALLLGSCGRIPEPVGYDYSKQQKLQAGHHWDVLAADVAREINRELILNDYLDTPVFIRETCGDEDTPCQPEQTTLFNESFRDLLITQLVRLGVPTSATPDNRAIIVNYKAQTIYHHAPRLRTIRPGLITALTAGVLVFRHAPEEFLALLTAGAVDAANSSFAHRGKFEVVITTSMIAGTSYLYRNSSIYYINDLDSWHYQTPAAPATISLTADARAPSPAEPTGAVSEPAETAEEPQRLPVPIIPESQAPESTGI